MVYHRISKLERDIETLEFEDLAIKKDVEKLKKELIEKAPEHFSKRDLLRSFVGSLFLGFSVLFSSNLLNVAKNISEGHLYLIVLFTIIVLSSEIYFIGYSRVQNKHERSFGQFWIKRLIAFYFVAFCVSFILVYVFGLIFLLQNPTELFSVIVIISAPCAIGASIGDLIKKY